MTHTRRTTWWIHGSAPGGEAFFDAALAAADVSVTTNAGLVEFLCHAQRDLRPDYYWLQDGRAVELFGRYAQTARALGCQVLSGGGLPDELAINHQRVIFDRRRPGPLAFVRGLQQHVTLSGLMCLQWVANRADAGDTLLLTGMTGYASTPKQLVPDTFDGRTGKAGGAAHTTDFIGPFTRSVCRVRDDLSVVFCGKPHRVFGPSPAALGLGNITVCTDSTGLQTLFTPPTKGHRHAPRKDPSNRTGQDPEVQRT